MWLDIFISQLQAAEEVHYFQHLIDTATHASLGGLGLRDQVGFSLLVEDGFAI